MKARYVNTEIHLSKNEASIRDILPEGTKVLDPAWFDEAILGYAFAPGGGISVAYSAEVCIDLLKRNLGLDTEDAGESLASVAAQFDGVAPVFVWGLD